MVNQCAMNGGGLWS